MENTRLQQNQVNIAGRIGYFLLNLSNAFSVAIPTFLILYGTNVLGIQIALISLMMALVKVFDGVTDVVAGFLIDATRTSKGRARPWLLWMCLPYGLCFAAEFWIPASWSLPLKTILLIVFYALTVSVFGTVVGIATNALLPRMTTSDKERGAIGAVCGGATVTMCGFLMAVVFPLQEKLGFTGTFTLFGGIVFVLTLVGYFLIRELPEEELEAATKNHGERVTFRSMVANLFSNQYALLMFVYVLVLQLAGSFIQGCGTYYAIYVLGSQDWYTRFMLIGSFGSLAGMILSAALVRAFGSKFVFVAGCLVALAGFVVIRLSGDNPIIVCIMFFFILMGGQVFTNGQCNVLSAQACDYGEWKNGLRADGVISCTGNVGHKIGSAVGTSLMGVLLGAAGLIEGGVVQPASAVDGIRLTYTVGTPVIYLVIAVFFMLTWKLQKQMPSIQVELTKRRQVARR